MDAQIAQNLQTFANMIMSNPVGTQRLGDQSLTNVSPSTVPAANWGGYPVSQRLYNTAQGAIGNALGWVGGTDTPGIRAFHGSPYDFNAFDSSKIGTGEGAQAYGHGLYFAGNPAVAETYKGVQGTASFDPMANIAAKTIAAGHDANSILKQIFPNATGDEIGSAIERSQQPPKGKMYEVNLNVQPQQLLDADKPLSGQPANVQRGLATITDRDFRPEDAGIDLIPNSAEMAARYNAAGIPGVQYLDQGSRASGEGTRNYVMFDPSLIEILRKYLLPFTTAGGAALAAQRQGNQ